MCLAIPPNSVRNQNHALPYPFQVGEASGNAASASSSAPTSYCGGSSSSSSPFDPFTLSPTPIFSCALGPTGFSPTATYNHGQNAGAAAAAVAASRLNGSLAAVVAPALLSNIPSPPPFSTSSSAKPRRTRAPRSKAASGSNTAKRRRRGPQRPGKTAMQKERLFVQHDYHDLSNEPDAPFAGIAKNNKTILSIPTTTTGLNESFPAKMHRILEETNAAGLSDIISWQPHGRAFKIRDPYAFTRTVMPQYFPKMKKLTSLQRQFNLYGFERLTRDGPDAGAYYHEAFLRHRPGLSAQRMFRKRIKGTGYKAAGNPDAEPDLYAMPSMGQRKNGCKSMSSVTQGFQAAAIAPVAASSSYHPSQAYQSSNNDGGVVTESTRSSYYSSSEEESGSNGNNNQEYHQIQPQAFVPAQVPSNLYMPQDNYSSTQPHQSNHLTTMDPGRNHVLSPTSSIDFTSMDKFLALPMATQDSYLQEFFSANDVTPMSPAMSPSPRQQQSQQQQQHSTSTNLHMSSNATSASQRRQSQEDHPILLEFADLWEGLTS